MNTVKVEITLGKALKLKNRLTGHISKLSSDIQRYNSVPEGDEKVDVPSMMEERDKLAGQLVSLKLAINAANQSVQQLIYELAELKSKIDLLSKLSTRHGQTVEGYPPTVVNYVAQIRQGAVAVMIRKLEKQIDARQDALDLFNHDAKVFVDAEMLADEAATSAA